MSGPLRSAGVLTFGPDKVLFVGDIAGAAVHAFALREADLNPQQGSPIGNFHNFEGRDLVQGIDAKVAAMLGTTLDDVTINDMVVHPAAEQIFLSVERGRSQPRTCHCEIQQGATRDSGSVRHPAYAGRNPG